MPKPLDPAIVEVLKKYGEDAKTAAWDCHGVWVVYHKAVERIAAKAGITFDMPEIIEANSANKTATIVVRGFMGDKAEWSFGEAAPANNKNAYPWAMAEKRAKDRVVLKLVGLHGALYSEEEADDFKPGSTASEPQQPPRKANGLPEKGWREDGTRTSYAIKTEFPELWDEFQRELAETTLVTMDRFKTNWRTKAAKERLNRTYTDAMKDEIERRVAELQANAPEPEDVFPGDLPSRREILNHPINAG